MKKNAFSVREKGMKLIKIGLAITLISCGATTKDTATQGLNSNPITLAPLPGIYTFMPWVKITKQDNSAGSGVVKIKGPDDTSFRASDSCVLESFADSLVDNCMEITKTGSWSYQLDSNDPISVQYTLNLATNNIAVDAKAELDGKAESFKLTEIETFCHYPASGNLEILIQLSQTDKLGTDRSAYVGAVLVNTKTGGSITINQDNNDITAGIAIIPVSDGVPSYYSDSVNNYTTSQNQVFTTGSDGVRPKSSCTFTLAEIDPGKVNKGSFTCTNLANDSNDVDASKIPLGKHLSLSGNWQCDKYH